MMLKLSREYAFFWKINIYFFFGAAIFPFFIINFRARKFDAQNPEEAAIGYKNNNSETYYGYEKVN